MIYHKGIFETGKVIAFDDAWGVNAIVTPRPLPPPQTESAVNRHLSDGALLVWVEEEPPLFNHESELMDQLLARLRQMKEFDAQANQCLLALVDDGQGRELHSGAAREWMASGGISIISESLESLTAELERFPRVERREHTLADWIAILPGISRRRARTLTDKYGARVIELFSTCARDETKATILRQEGFEGMSLAELRRIRNFFELEGDHEFRTYQLGEEEKENRFITSKFLELAVELGGKARIDG